MNIPEKNRVPVDLIARYLNGDADTDDIIDLEKWKSQSGDNRKVFDEYRTIWEKTGQLSLFTDIDIENEWNVFLENVHFEEVETKSRQFPDISKPHIRIAAAIIAGIILSISGYFSYHALKFEKLIAKNEVLEVILPDGSAVTLNKGSRLLYPEKLSGTRELRLNGEAFFKVRTDPDLPFIIKSGGLRVEVADASFNVYAFRKENIVQVIVESGKVSVYNEDDTPFQRDLLKKGERMIYSRKSGIRSVQPNTDLNYKSWKTAVLQFENSSLQHIINTLENHFNSQITLVNSLLNDCRITISFDNKSLEYILETITETLDLNLVKTENGYFIDGIEC